MVIDDFYSQKDGKLIGCLESEDSYSEYSGRSDNQPAKSGLFNGSETARVVNPLIAARNQKAGKPYQSNESDFDSYDFYLGYGTVNENGAGDIAIDETSNARKPTFSTKPGGLMINRLSVFNPLGVKKGPKKGL